MTISAHPSPGFAIPPFAVEDYPIGSCVVNAQGFNCLAFRDKPGVKFTPHKNAQQICDLWNGLRVKNAGDCHG